MKFWTHAVVLIVLFVVVQDIYSQIETKRWWHANTDRTVFCADIESLTLEELQQWVASEKDKRVKTEVYIRMINKLQQESFLNKAIQYVDSAMRAAERQRDSLSICLIHIASVYNMDMSGSPGGMLEEATKARTAMPQSVKNTIVEFKVYTVTGEALCRMLQCNEAEIAYTKAKNIITNLGNVKCLGMINLNLGRALKGSGKLDKAIEVYKEGLAIFEESQDMATCCLFYGELASVYADMGLKGQQLDYLYKTLTCAESLENPLQQAAVYRDLGYFYSHQNDSLLTTEFYNKAIATYLSVPNAQLPRIGSVYNDMADFYQYIGDETKTLHYQRLAMQKYETVPRLSAFATYKMGYFHQYYNHFDSAYYYYTNAYKQTAVLSDPRLLATCAKGFADYYQTKGDINKAISYLQESYKQAGRIRWLEMICELSDKLSDLYVEVGNYRQAYLFQMRFQGLSDSLYRVEDARRIARISAQHEFSEKEARMNMQISEQERKISRQTFLSILLIGIVGLISIIVVLTWRNSFYRRKLNLKLQEQTAELASINEELAATNEEVLAVNEELQKTYDELEDYKGSLEKMVNVKTSELQEALVQVQESDKFKAAFFANMSHEIRTPLNAVLGFLQFINNPGMTQEKQDAMMELINVHATQLLSLVDDIVDLSKIDSGLLTIRPASCNVNELLVNLYEKATKMIRYAGKEKLVVIMDKSLLASDNIQIIDGKRIEQVLSYLIDNAVKYTEMGYIRFGCERLSEMHLNFFVEDTGVGIPKENQEDVFKRFWRQGDVLTHRYRGVGIGLSLSHALVDMMDGSFSLESTVGQGTTIRFSIKIYESTTEQLN